MGSLYSLERGGFRSNKIQKSLNKLEESINRKGKKGVNTARIIIKIFLYVDDVTLAAKTSLNL